MNRQEFEACSGMAVYDEFIAAALDYDGLSMEDYKSFMPFLFEIIPARQEKDALEMYRAAMDELGTRMGTIILIFFTVSTWGGFTPFIVIVEGL